MVRDWGIADPPVQKRKLPGCTVEKWGCERYYRYRDASRSGRPRGLDNGDRACRKHSITGALLRGGHQPFPHDPLRTPSGY